MISEESVKLTMDAVEGVAGEDGEEGAGRLAGDGGNMIGGEEEKVKVGA